MSLQYVLHKFQVMKTVQCGENLPKEQVYNYYLYFTNSYSQKNTQCASCS